MSITKNITIIFSLLLLLTLSSCKDYSNYKNEEGYQEYISDADAGY